MTDRVRGRYDMPRVIKVGVSGIAERLGVSHSMVAAVLLAHSLHQHFEGDISMDDVQREPSASPKYEEGL